MTHLDPDADPHEVNRCQQVRGQEIGALRREAKQPGRRSRRVRDLMRPVVMSMRKHGQSLGEIASVPLLSGNPGIRRACTRPEPPRAHDNKI